MTDLLHQLTTTPAYEHTIWIILLVGVGINMLSFISRFEDAEKFTIDINGFSSPYYNLNLYLTEPNKKIFMSAYSNFDDDMLWDEIIEWVDDPR